MTWRLICPKCGWTGYEEEYYPYCPSCGSPLELGGVLQKPDKPILGEGNTPLVKDKTVVYKLEYLNPTGSFKDRGVSLSVWIASRLGYKCVTVDSSGNTAISTAAYASRLGLESHIHVPAGADESKTRIVRFLGGKLYIHNTREEAYYNARREADKCYYIAHQSSPIFLEGIKTLGEELSRDLREESTDIVLPVSSGSLLLGVVRGLGTLREKTRIIAVQSTRAPWLKKYRRPSYEDHGSSRLLDALVVKDPPRAREIANEIDELVILGDKSVLPAWRQLARKGFLVEPSSAVVEAARIKLELDHPVLVLTGSGLKYHHKMDVLEQSE
ncbi:MAG: pyridoxal-phosphate dependent enzyme [Desulfurococcales archaeon]|nr:pyridoxal-phosphate dependent enzyme [Desulfurococcales archaeon]